MLSLPRLLLLCSLSFLLACSPQENVQTDQGPMPAGQPGSEELGSGLERDKYEYRNCTG